MRLCLDLFVKGHLARCLPLRSGGLISTSIGEARKIQLLRRWLGEALFRHLGRFYSDGPFLAR